jgi:hypothetical protein
MPGKPLRIIPRATTKTESAYSLVADTADSHQQERGEQLLALLFFSGRSSYEDVLGCKRRL